MEKVWIRVWYIQYPMKLKLHTHQISKTGKDEDGFLLQKQEQVQSNLHCHHPFVCSKDTQFLNSM